jgi:hypothetical protein
MATTNAIGIAREETNISDLFPLEEFGLLIMQVFVNIGVL